MGHRENERSGAEKKTTGTLSQTGCSAPYPADGSEQTGDPVSTEKRQEPLNHDSEIKHSLTRKAKSSHQPQRLSHGLQIKLIYLQSLHTVVHVPSSLHPSLFVHSGSSCTISCRNAHFTHFAQRFAYLQVNCCECSRFRDTSREAEAQKTSLG